ncbi:MAG: thermonuclease family protein [Geminicoccaceae bacterium]
MSLKAAIMGLIGDDQVEIEPDPVIPYDRYGCLRARVRMTAGQWLGRSIVEQGLALVRPAPGSNGAIDDLLMLEDEARSAARGLWQTVDARPKSADALDHRIGTNEIVEGRVTRVSSNDRYVYLNFGADWRTDFTIRLDQRMVAAEELDVRRFEGKKLRVRGFIQEARGPLIDIVNPKQIEVLP